MTLEEKHTAYVFTANTPHVAQAELMLDSLRDPNKGNFKGDIWVISTDLTLECMHVLDSMNIKYLVNPLQEWSNWKAKDLIIDNMRLESKFIDPNDIFNEYRNKRMSKLILLDWIEKFGHKYDIIGLCDNDLYIQKDIHDLYEKVYADKSDSAYYWQEEYKIQGTPLADKEFHYLNKHYTDPNTFGEHEINIGFVLASPNRMNKIWSEIKKHFLHLSPALFAKFGWHDQDLTRLVRAEHPEWFKLFEEGEVVHLCAGGDKVVDEKCPLEFYHKKTDEKPYVIHFAGGLWRDYP